MPCGTPTRPTSTPGSVSQDAGAEMGDRVRVTAADGKRLGGPRIPTHSFSNPRMATPTRADAFSLTCEAVAAPGREVA